MNDTGRFMVGLIMSVILILMSVILIIAECIELWMFIIMNLLSILLIIAPVLTFRGTRISIDDDSITILAPFVNEIVEFGKMDSVSTCTILSYGRREYGYNGKYYGSGTYSGGELGGYTRASDSRVPISILIIAGNRKILFNMKTLEETQRIYMEIKAHDGGKCIAPSAMGAHPRRAGSNSG